MNRKSSVILTLIVLNFLVACSPHLVPFTQELREQQKLTEQELKSLQFYVSNTFVLRRGENKTEKVTDKGELTLKNDAYVEEIVIKAGTPCKIVQVVDGDRVTVSFGDGASKYLVFGSIHNNDGYYTLMAMEWVQGKGKLNYGEQLYYSSPGSRDVFLAIKMKSLQQFRTEQKVVKGDKL